jgi:hypothetical protein
MALSFTTSLGLKDGELILAGQGSSSTVFFFPS